MCFDVCVGVVEVSVSQKRRQVEYEEDSGGRVEDGRRRTRAEPVKMLVSKQVRQDVVSKADPCLPRQLAGTKTI